MKKVIIKKMIVIECWCPECGHGQMEDLMKRSFEEKKQLEDFIDTKIKCLKCGESLQVDDVVNLIPESFQIASYKNIKSHIKDTSVKEFLNK